MKRYAGFVLAPMLVATLAAAAPTRASQTTVVYLKPHLQNQKLRDLSIDTTTMPGHRLLRYRSAIVNTGAGPLEIYGSRPDTTQANMTTVWQRLYDGNGGHKDIPLDSSMFWAGDGHNHWHLANLDIGELYSKVTGQRTGATAKRGFCFFDNVLAGSTQPAYYTTANTCASGQPNALQAMMGLSVGWGDQYPAQVMWQWVDVTALPDGAYRLAERISPKLTKRHADLTNSGAWVDIELAGNTITVTRVGAGL